MMESSLKRIFIVGCPRSGTTYLQSLMASHPDLVSYPETHFWELTVPEKTGYRLLKVYTSREKRMVRDYLEKYSYPVETLEKFGACYLSYKGWSRALGTLLDELVPGEKKGWVEKTPRHLHYIPFIQESIPRATFIHMLREGKDVVASMYEVSRKYPEHWNGARSIEKCVDRWIEDIRLSRQYVGKANHCFVRYENLIKSTRSELRRLCGSIGLSYSEHMMEEYREEARDLIGREEAWKASNIHGRKRENKFKRIFSEEEQEYILERTGELSLAPFDLKQTE